MVGLYSAFGFLITLSSHLTFEETVIPTGIELLTITFMGIATYGTAFALWDYGVKKGNLKLLSILSYGTPIVSVGLLVICGYSAPTTSLALACSLVVMGSTLPLMLVGIKEVYSRMSFSSAPEVPDDTLGPPDLELLEKDVLTPKPYS